MSEGATHTQININTTIDPMYSPVIWNSDCFWKRIVKATSLILRGVDWRGPQ